MRWLKRGLAVLLLGVMVYLFWPLLGELRKAVDLFSSAHWAWLPVIIGVQALSYASLTWLNALTLRPFSGRIGFFQLAGTLTSMAFISVAIPSAGASGIALRARLLGRFGYSLEESTFTLILESMYVAAALTTVGILGLVYLLDKGQMSLAELVRLSLVGAVVIALIVFFWSLLYNHARTRRIVFWSVSLWNRLFGRWRPVDLGQVDGRLVKFYTDLEKLKEIPRWQLVLTAYGRVLFDVATLGACFWLFGFPIDPGTLFTGYGLILLISGLSIVPGGLGVADASVPVVFARLGAPGHIALAAGLSYRLLAFWLVRFIGFINWQILEALRRKPR
jgi:uncharacterized protein (TIRG00374 family)